MGSTLLAGASLGEVRSDAYDELALLEGNAAEHGLTWSGPPEVARREVALSGGGVVSALQWGGGPPVALLVHGSAQNAHTWDTVALALRRPLVAVDLPGHGQSTWRPDHDYSPGVLAGALAEAAVALAPSARLVVGMSLGGLAAISLAARRPRLVPALVIVDITPGVDARKAKAITDFVSGPERFGSFEEILERTVLHNPGRSVESLRRGVLHNAREMPDGSWAWRWDPVRHGGPPGTEPGQARLALWEALGTTRMPLTLVRGSLSPVVDDRDVEELLERRPDARMVTVEGAGHSVQGDRPLELAAVLAPLLPAG